MSKFMKFLRDTWFLILLFLVAFALIGVLLHTMDEGAKMRDQAEKLCYPYVMLYQNDEIIVCAGIEEPAVKKRK